MRILIFADIHLHEHPEFDRKNPISERLMDGLDALGKIFALAKKQKCEQIYFLGDLFHKRHVIRTTTFHRIHTVLRSLCDVYQIPTTLLAGNHDQSTYDETSLAGLSGIPHLQIVDQPLRVHHLGATIDLVPYQESREDFLADIANLQQQNPPPHGHVPHYLFCHQAVYGARRLSFEHTPGYVVTVEDIPAYYEHIYSGHYHVRQTLQSRFTYIGSPLHIDRSDVGEKKFTLILDSHDGETWIENKLSPRFMRVRLDENPDPKTFKGNFVDCIYTTEDLKPPVSTKEDIEIWLQRAGARGYNVQLESVSTPFVGMDSHTAQMVHTPMTWFDAHVKESDPPLTEASIVLGRDLLSESMRRL